MHLLYLDSIQTHLVVEELVVLKLKEQLEAAVLTSQHLCKHGGSACIHYIYSILPSCL